MRAAYFLRNGGLAVGGLLVGSLLGSALVAFEGTVLAEFVYPIAGMDVREWLERYRNAAMGGIFWMLLAVVAWHGIALIGTGKTSAKRPVWLLLWAVTAASGVLAWYLGVPATEKWGWLSFLFCCVVNPGLIFWVSTVFFTPAPFKFTPILAGLLRRW